MPQVAEDQAENLIFDYLNAQSVIDALQRESLDLRLDLRNRSFTRGFIPKTQRQLGRLERDYTRFYTTKIPNIYLDGVKSVVGDSAYRLNNSDGKIIHQIQKRGMSDLNAAHASVTRDTKRFVKLVRDEKDPEVARGAKRSNRLDISYPDTIIDRHGIKAVKFSDGKRYTLGDYSSMSIRSNSNLAYNLGSLNAAKRKGVQVVEVSDGPECGWTRHDDSDKANGSLRTIEEAMAFPTAHPNCKRAFHARPDLKKDDIKHPGLSTAKKTALLGAGLAGAGGLVALAAKSDTVIDLEKRIVAMALRGNPLAQFFTQRINAAKGLFIGERELAPVVPGQFRLGVRDVLQSTDQIGPESIFFRRIVNDVMTEANKFNEGLTLVNERTRAVIGARAKDKKTELTRKFRLFARFDRALRENDLARHELANVIDFEVRARKLNQASLFSEKARSGIKGTWTKFGPRVKTDITDFFKGDITFTPKGVIKGISSKSIKGFRSNLKMLQDGSLAGHISMVPKGIFRGIVEVDEYGKLVGNIRVIPKGPLKLRLEFHLPGFNARAIKSVEGAVGIRDDLLTAIKSGTRRVEQRQKTLDLARLKTGPGAAKKVKDAETAFSRAVGTQRANVKRLNDFDSLLFNLEHPTLKDLIHDIRQLELKRIVLDYRIFKMGPLDISGSLRMPLETILKALKSEENRLSLVKEGSGYTGHFLVEAPKSVFNGLKEVAEDFKIFGEMRFSKLSTVMRGKIDLGNLNLQSIATSLKVRGYNVYNIADIMSLKVSDVNQLISNRIDGVKNLFTTVGVMRPEDLSQLFNERIENVLKRVELVRKGGQEGQQQSDNRSEVIDQAIHTLDGSVSATVRNRSILSLLADLKPGDGQQTIERKLWALRQHLMTDQVDRQAVVNEIRASMVSRIKKFDSPISLPDGPLDLLGRITKGDIKFLARKIIKALEEEL